MSFEVTQRNKLRYLVAYSFGQIWGPGGSRARPFPDEEREPLRLVLPVQLEHLGIQSDAQRSNYRMCLPRLELSPIRQRGVRLGPIR